MTLVRFDRPPDGNGASPEGYSLGQGGGGGGETQQILRKKGITVSQALYVVDGRAGGRAGFLNLQFGRYVRTSAETGNGRNSGLVSNWGLGLVPGGYLGQNRANTPRDRDVVMTQTITCRRAGLRTEAPNII